MGYWPVVKRVIKDSDIVLEIVDARMTHLSRNEEVERLIRRHNKKLIVVVNKIDLVSRDFLNKLRRENKDAFFVSGNKNIGLSNLKRGIMITAKRMKIEEPKVSVVGYPNVGKSAVINALSKRGKARVSERAGTTKGIQWIKAGSIRILDSPGVVPIEDNEIKLGVLGAKNPEKLRDPERVAFAIIRKILDFDRKILEEKYGISAEGDEYDILVEIGVKKGFLIKGGRVDENRASYKIIKDWQKGEFRF